MPTVLVYRRALRRFATSIVFTILDLAVCALMLYRVSECRLSPLLLLLTVPLALTLVKMWRSTVRDLACIGAAVSSADAKAPERASAQV